MILSYQFLQEQSLKNIIEESIMDNDKQKFYDLIKKVL